MASVATNNILQTFFSETLQLIQARNQDFVCVCVWAGGRGGARGCVPQEPAPNN